MSFNQNLNPEKLREIFNNNKSKIGLKNLTVATIRDRFLTLLNQNLLSDEEKEILFDYLDPTKKDRNLDLTLIIKKNQDDFKTLQNLLLNRTQNHTKSKLFDTTAILLDCNKKESIKSKSKEKESLSSIDKNIEINIHNHIHQKKWLIALPVVGIVAIAAFYFMNSKKNSQICAVWDKDRYTKVPCNQISKDTQVLTINTKEININTFRKIPINQVSEYIKENKNTTLWYASNNNTIEFFSESGNHPVSGSPLLPVTKKILNPYLQNNRDTTLLQTKNNIETKQKKIISVQVEIYNNKQKDLLLSNLFKQQITFSEPYSCTGEVIYSYRNSTINKDLIICDLFCSYKIVSNKTQTLLEEKTITTTGTGFTKSMAKQQAINKIGF